MKTIAKIFNLTASIILIATAVCFTSCNPDWFSDAEPVEQPQGPGNEWGNGPEVDTSNPNDVADNSSVTEGNNPVNEENGTPPGTTTNVQHPAKIWGHQPQVEASPDQTIFLPFQFEVSVAAQWITTVYVQITGANTYWRVEQNSGAQTGQILLSVKIPTNMKTPGEFKVNYRIQDDNGIVSNVLETTVKVVDIADCSDIQYNGSSGLTVRSINLGDKAGTAEIYFKTYTLKDRLDVFYGGQWIWGTGSSISYGTPPPKYNCETSPIVDGYISTGSLSEIHKFQYDPNKSQRLDVYISGCFGRSTEWELLVYCPE